MSTKRREILFPRKCKICKKEFVYCLRSGSDFRCYECKQNLMTLEDVEKELANMSDEEYQSFMDDIREYEDSQKKL